jgi:hypothetical protein
MGTFDHAAGGTTSAGREALSEGGPFTTKITRAAVARVTMSRAINREAQDLNTQIRVIEDP